jgi:rod shape-determining protein MreD
MRRYRTPIIVILCGILLCTIAAQLNHYLSSLHISVFVGGLLVVFPALRLRHRHGWRIIVPLGLWCDAATPLPFGLLTMLFLIAHAVIFQLRSRIPRAEPLVGVAVALIANIALFAAVAIFCALRRDAPSGLALRLFVDLLASELLIALIGPWFFAVQEHALALFNAAPPRNETQP